MNKLEMAMLREMMIDTLIKNWPYMENHEPHNWSLGEVWYELRDLIENDRINLKLTRNIVKAYGVKYRYIMFEPEALEILEEE